MPGFTNTGNRSTTARGYGANHQRARAKAFTQLPEYSPCSRCGKTMWKHAKDRHGRSTLHYDHNATRTGYLGFSCADCNRRAGAANGGRKTGRRNLGLPARQRLTASWNSRTW